MENIKIEYTKEDIEELIEDVEFEFEGFERPTAYNSNKMLEALKQLVKLFAINDVIDAVCSCSIEDLKPDFENNKCKKCGKKIVD